MTQEVLKLALEALELVNMEFVCDGAHHAKKDRHKLGDDCPVTTRYQQAITAIKEALRENAMREVQRLGQEIEQKLIGTVGDLFDDKVIAHRKLDRDLLVYIKEKNA